MPIIPTFQRTIAQPTYQFVPPVSAEGFEETGRQVMDLQMAQARVEHAQDMVDVAEASDKRDELYHQRQMETKPDELAAMSPAEFQKAWHEQATADDQAVMEGLSPSARRYGQLAFARMQRQAFDRDFRQYQGLYVDRQRGAFIDSLNDAERKIANAQTPEDVQAEKDNLQVRFAQAQSSGLFKAEEIAKQREEVGNKITEGQATGYLNRYDFTGFDKFAESPDFKALPAQSQYRLFGMRNSQYNHITSLADKIAGQARKDLLNQLTTKANFGLLPPDFLQSAMRGEIPNLTADDGRHLKDLNDNPPGGEGTDQVSAIMQDYAMGERTVSRIRAARARLQNLARHMTNGNKALIAAGEKLQADQNAAENTLISRDNVEVQRQNREIGNLKTTYDAWVQTNPMIKKFLGNVDESQKAQIADVYRNQGPEAAKAKLDTFIKRGSEKVKVIQEKHADVLDY